MTARRQSPLVLTIQYVILAIGLLFSSFPIYFVFQAALRPGNTLYSTELQLWPANATLDNFRYVLTQIPLPLWIWNSLKVSVATTIATLLITVSAGYALSRFKFRGRGSVLTSLLALQAFPAALALPALYLILNTFGLLNSHLGLILIYSAGAIAFNVWNLKGYFDTIPIDLEEAATIDGCTPTQAFLLVMLPLARPALAVTALFSFMTAWNEFILAATLLNDAARFTLPVALQRYVGEYKTEWGHFAAGAIVVSVPVMALFFALQKHLVGGLTAGGVKG